jgi:adenosylcobinamide-GDP ribazoletransferase
MKLLFAAVRFLTIVPVPVSDAALGRAAAFFPLVGAAIGAVGALIFLTARLALPDSLAALLTVCFWTLISGVLHEDGLADVADAVRAGRSRERMMAILKDSRIGAFGAVMLVLSLLARWQALQFLSTPRAFAAIVASQAVPRSAMIALAWAARPAGSGLGSALSSSLGTGSALLAMAQGIAAALLCGWRPGLVIIAGSVLILRISQMWFYRRLGGVNGDGLGFVEQLLEIFVLVLFACRSCAWT